MRKKSEIKPTWSPIYSNHVLLLKGKCKINEQLDLTKDGVEVSRGKEDQGSRGFITMYSKEGREGMRRTGLKKRLFHYSASVLAPIGTAIN